MKRYGNLFHKIYDLENIKLAHKNARKGKTFYREVKMVDENIDKYSLEIQSMLMNKTFTNSEYTVFEKKDKGKLREIYKLPYFPDRIIHHCIMQVLEPIWHKVLIDDTFQSIKGRGIHKAQKRIEPVIRRVQPKYSLKIDIKKFYPSIDNEILKQIVRKKIKCNDTLWLIDEIIDSTSGVPIGNYMSQYFGNLYLGYFDHWMKENKRVKYYYRYCDDIVVLHNDKKYLHLLLNDMRIFLNKELKLTIKENYQIAPINKRGVDFLGFRFFFKYTLLRKKISKGFKRGIALILKFYDILRIEKIQGVVMSYYGWIKHSSGFNLWNKYVTYKVKNIFVQLKLKNKIILGV